MNLYIYFCITTDINECLSNNGNCSQSCTNTNGSYFCLCQTGYMTADDNMTCKGKCSVFHYKREYKLKFFPNTTDINECLFSNGNCSQACTNTNGSYFCSCQNGYMLSDDSMTCNGKYSLLVMIGSWIIFPNTFNRNQ